MRKFPYFKITSLALAFLFTLVTPLAYTVQAKQTSKDSGAVVLHYTFDGNVTDSSEYGNDGQVVGEQMKFEDAESGGAVKGQAAVFDGNYIEVPDSDSLDMTDAFSINVWIYKEPNSELDKHEHHWAPIVVKGDNEYTDETTPYALVHDYDNYSPAVRLVNSDDSSTLTCSKEVSVQKWHMITATWNGTFVKFYVDGVLVDTQTWKGSLMASDGKLFIGCNIPDKTAFFKGKMDELTITNGELTSEQIKAYYDEAVPAMQNEKKLVAYYKFDGNTKDYSEFKNDGKVVGSNITYGELKDGKAVAGKAAIFSGSNYIEVNDKDCLDFSNAFSISTWIYKSAVSSDKNRWAPVVVKGGSEYLDETTPYALVHDYDNFSPAVRLYNTEGGDTVYGEFDIGNQKWYMLTVTWNGQDIKYYIDGKLRSTQSWKGELFSSDGKLFIGCNIPDRTVYFKGMLDELRLYNYDLSTQEIAKLYTLKDDITITGVTSNKVVLKKGKVLNFNVTVKPVSGTALNVTTNAKTTSSNIKAVQVVGGKSIKAVNKGSSVITIRYGNAVKTFTVIVQ